jgi:hypothetical protein
VQHGYCVFQFATIGINGHSGEDYRGIALQDFRHIIDNLSVGTANHAQDEVAWVNRVRIHCRGSQELKFEHIKYSQDHPIFTKGCVVCLGARSPSLLRQLDLPIITDQGPLDLQAESAANHLQLIVKNNQQLYPPASLVGLVAGGYPACLGKLLFRPQF